MDPEPPASGAARLAVPPFVQRDQRSAGPDHTDDAMPIHARRPPHVAHDPR